MTDCTRFVFKRVIHMRDKYCRDRSDRTKKTMSTEIIKKFILCLKEACRKRQKSAHFAAAAVVVEQSQPIYSVHLTSAAEYLKKCPPLARDRNSDRGQRLLECRNNPESRPVSRTKWLSIHLRSPLANRRCTEIPHLSFNINAFL